MYDQLPSDDPNPKRGLWVTFHPGKVPVPARSQLTGKPEFDLVDFIEIRNPGDMLNVIDRPVTERDKSEYPQQWQAYKNATEYRPQSGTPVEDWPRLDVATVAKLKALGFHTVEQIADCSDAQCQAIGMGCYELRTKAIAYVAAAKDSALAQKQADDIAQKNMEIADLKAALSRAMDRITALEMNAAPTDAPAEGKRGPGRPPRIQQPAEV